MKKRNRFAAPHSQRCCSPARRRARSHWMPHRRCISSLGMTVRRSTWNRNHPTGVFDYDTLSDHYRQHLDAVRSNPTLAVEYWGYDDLEGLSFGWDGDLEECYRDTARAMTEGDEYKLRCQLSVQLNGAYVHFADAQPEKVNGRVMVPFRAIAEVLGAEVDYNAGAITAKKNGQTLAFSLGGKQLTITDDSTGKVIKTTSVDSAPYKKGGRTYVPVRFFAEGFGLTVQWDQGYADRRAV